MTTVDLGNDLALTIREELSQAEGLPRIGMNSTELTELADLVEEGILMTEEEVSFTYLLAGILGEFFNGWVVLGVELFQDKAKLLLKNEFLYKRFRTITEQVIGNSVAEELKNLDNLVASEWIDIRPCQWLEKYNAYETEEGSALLEQNRTIRPVSVLIELFFINQASYEENLRRACRQSKFARYIESCSGQMLIITSFMLDDSARSPEFYAREAEEHRKFKLRGDALYAGRPDIYFDAVVANRHDFYFALLKAILSIDANYINHSLPLTIYHDAAANFAGHIIKLTETYRHKKDNSSISDLGRYLKLLLERGLHQQVKQIVEAMLRFGISDGTKTGPSRWLNKINKANKKPKARARRVRWTNEVLKELYEKYTATGRGATKSLAKEYGISESNLSFLLSKYRKSNS